MTDASRYRRLALAEHLSLLRRLVEMVRTAPPTGRTEYGDMMRVVAVDCRFDLRRLAEDVGVSYSTVHRWQEGVSAPHPMLFPTMFAWVVAALETRIRETESALAEIDGTIGTEARERA